MVSAGCADAVSVAVAPKTRKVASVFIVLLIPQSYDPRRASLLGIYWPRDTSSNCNRRLLPKIYLPALPIGHADVIELTQAITPGRAVKRVVRRPERNHVHANGPGHFNGFRDVLGMIVPVEQKIFPFQDRLVRTARVAIRHHVAHGGVGFVEIASLHVFFA